MVFTRSLLTLSFVYATAVVSAQQNFSLYAYGKHIESGLKLFYGDGLAYVGASAPSFVSEAVNVTFYKSGSKDANSVEFVATPDHTVDSWTEDLVLSINMTTGSNNPVTFVKESDTPPSNTSVTGWGLYGGWAFHEGDGGPVAMNFLATPTNESAIYLVKWNTGATKADDEIAISLRTLAPMTGTT